MAKKLSEMTLEELWQLFPIILTEHKDCWADWYREEERTLRAILPADLTITHIGSTAVRGIAAKPIIDILIEVPPETGLDPICDLLTARGYICMSRSREHIALNKGYTEQGFAERVFHVHLHYTGDRDEVLFRDYLNAHPETARENERLKLSLWKRYEHDRDGYTMAKTAFVDRVMEQVRGNAGTEGAIRTDRLLIRRVRAEDHEAIREIWSAVAQTDLARYDRPNDLNEEAVRVRIARWAEYSRSTEHIFFAVCLEEKLIGYIALNVRENGYEMGYCFHPAYHGNGYAYESISAALKKAERTGIRRIEAGTALENTPSVKLLERLGFRQTGTEQVSFYKDVNGDPVTFEGGIFVLNM